MNLYCRNVFLENQDFLFYKTFVTLDNNNIHGDWTNTFDIMWNDVKKLDFDIALVSCGGYGTLFCDKIKTEMHKSAIYIGGALQLYFGVLGSRWSHRLPVYKKVLDENPQKYVRPMASETIKNSDNFENSCYW